MYSRQAFNEARDKMLDKGTGIYLRPPTVPAAGECGA
jgi:hypothetical protein